MAKFACQENLSRLDSRFGVVGVPAVGTCVRFRFTMELLGIW